MSGPRRPVFTWSATITSSGSGTPLPTQRIGTRRPTNVRGRRRAARRARQAPSRGGGAPASAAATGAPGARGVAASSFEQVEESALPGERPRAASPRTGQVGARGWETARPGQHRCERRSHDHLFGAGLLPALVGRRRSGRLLGQAWSGPDKAGGCADDGLKADAPPGARQDGAAAASAAEAFFKLNSCGDRRLIHPVEQGQVERREIRPRRRSRAARASGSTPRLATRTTPVDARNSHRSLW